MAIVTIGGNVGAGKTTLAAKLAKALHYEELYMGGVFRGMAAERGMPIQAFYLALKDDPTLERAADEKQKKLMMEKDNVVVQGRVAWFFAKQSPFMVFNIFLGVTPQVGAARAGEREENTGRTIEEMLVINATRESSELERYAKLYGIKNFLDHTHYDLVLDTSDLTEDQVLEKILKSAKAALKL